MVNELDEKFRVRVRRKRLRPRLLARMVEEERPLSVLVDARKVGRDSDACKGRMWRGTVAESYHPVPKPRRGEDRIRDILVGVEERQAEVRSQPWSDERLVWVHKVET